MKTQENPLVSIIVPIYNSEESIRSCLNSIINQTYKNIEIIVVDDGSNDESYKIIRDYYPLVRYVYQQNQGQGSARNRGIVVSDGEWICFCDSDDTLEPNFLEDMIECIDDENDIIVCGINRIKNGKLKKDKLPRKKVLDSREALVLLNPGPTNKLFRRTILKNSRFYSIRKRYEDLASFPEFVINSRSIKIVHKYSYNYFIHENSTMRKWDARISDIFDILDYIREQKYYLDYKEEIDFLIIKHGLFGHVSRTIYFDYKCGKKSYEEAVEYLSKYVPNFRKNRYLNSTSYIWMKVGVCLYDVHLLFLLSRFLKYFEHSIKK